MKNPKILFLNSSHFSSSSYCNDYLEDSIFIGLRRLLGNNLVDYPRHNRSYKGFFSENGGNIDKKSFYGKGFTLYGLLEDIEIDRIDIENKIKNNYFDFIIYPAVWGKLNLFELVTLHYSRDKICFLDGNDSDMIRYDLIGRGLYFKRELKNSSSYIKPICYSIPREKIIDKTTIKDKKNMFATCDPRDKSTYIYDTEIEYYNGYKKSWFAYTCKKGGWDCLRHYEILANGCLPVIIDFKNIPLYTMIFFPKYECNKIIYLYKQAKIGLCMNSKLKELEQISNNLLVYTKNNLTCEAIAKYLIKEIKNEKTISF